ncbi:MAG TPA: MFS transporter [Nocardioides sp.]|uniref:MFS transporter n=1 Tax=uncultured Nocardioides sp. TaxID=198441 RepID=UPI000EE929B8|nr:MFS transporter [uncultured Nocardioides sp.]HCB07424.1 MFS transporter [Nocardioides sp.]HRD60249.1 MFS transporter [Nocardioides sp.]HRI94353.1 MFS transporter [Nocardioides sp.]HRK44542.1 MFS transporter [Nocardioides sp.]
MNAASEDHPLRHAPFRWLLSGTTVNLLGGGIAPVALAFAVLDLGGGASELGLVVGLYALADVGAVLFGGVLGDRLPRTVMLQGSAAAAAVVQGLVAASLIGGWSSIPLLAVLGMANGCLSALGGPSSSAITQQTVPAALLQRAISWRRIAQNVALIIGSGVAGLLVVGVGSGWALAFDALTFALAALLFSRIRVAPAPVPAREGLWGDVAEGFREVLRHTWLWLLILQALLYHLFYGGAQSVLGPIVVGDSLGRPAWGWALSAMMLGFVIGGVVTLRWRPRHALFVGTCFLSLTAAFPLAMAWSDSLLVVLIGAWLHGFGLEIFSVGWDLSIQEQVAPDKLARVYSFDMIGSFIARPVGLSLTGPLAVLVGPRTWLTIVGVVILASVLVALTSTDVRRLQRRDEATDSPEAVVATVA